MHGITTIHKLNRVNAEANAIVEKLNALLTPEQRKQQQKELDEYKQRLLTGLK